MGARYIRRRTLFSGTPSWPRDADPDVAIVNQRRQVALLQNMRSSGHWLKINPVVLFGNRRGIGMEILIKQGNSNWRHMLARGTSYAATHQPMVFTGFRFGDQSSNISVRWNNGKVQVLEGIKPDQEIVVLERDAK